MRLNERHTILLRILLVVLFATAGGLFSYAWLARERPAPPPPPSAPPPAAAALPSPDAGVEPAQEAVVSAVTGKVEKLRGGDWTSLQVGERLRSADAIRAAAHARADVEMGAGARLTVAEETELKLTELTATSHRIQIERGRVSVDYAEQGERSLRIERADGGAFAEARGARFSIMATQNAFAVATETGVVNLRSAGATVAVAAGEQSVAQVGLAPSAAAPIPVKLLLKVANASRKPGPCTQVEGKASPGAEVLVEGVRAAVDPEGRFRAELADGAKERVHVVMRDVTGRTREESLECRRKAKPSPGIDGMQIRWE